MNAFYTIKYFGKTGAGGGTIYIGKGVVVGIDIQGATIDGTYEVLGDRMKGVVRITAPKGGSTLVTGQTLPGGEEFPLPFDLPVSSFADGSPQKLEGYGGEPIEIVFEKVRDLN
jgi:hypothetical protein